MVSLPPGPEDLVNAHSNPGHTLPLTLMGLVESDRTGVLSVSQALTFDTSMYPKKACAVVYMPHAHRSKWGPFRVCCAGWGRTKLSGTVQSNLSVLVYLGPCYRK